jgi:hypothetical protein
MARASRIAIIGAKGFQRSDDRVEIECFAWEKVAGIANPSDYDAIILNLTSLTDRTAVDWDGFFEKFTMRTTLEVLVNRGNIVIIGDPRFWPNEPIVVPGGEKAPGRQFLEWTGIKFDWDKNPGRTKIYAELDPSTKRYLNYMEKISHWNYCLKGSSEEPRQLSSILDDMLMQHSKTKLKPEIDFERICRNRYGGLIVFTVKLSITEWIDVGISDWRPANTREGRIIFLPEIDVPQEEMVSMVLTDILKVRIIVPEPSWASAIVAPGQPRVDARITQIRHDISSLEVELLDAEEEREKTRHCVHLLYKLGDELEDAVRETLRSLGSTIEPPTEPGKEDGWIRVEIEGQTFEGVLEIKGTNKDHFNIDGLRQLMEWKKRGILNRDKKYKGIFVGNSGAEKEVSEREVPFAKPWTDTAKLDEIAVLGSGDLYTLYCLDREGNLDKEQFWRALFRTNGVFSLDDLGQPETTITGSDV